jgi:hypothetical protein
VALYGELELQRLLNQFFDRAIYYAVLGYEEAGRCSPKGALARVRDLAVSIGLISDKELASGCEQADAILMIRAVSVD